MKRSPSNQSRWFEQRFCRQWCHPWRQWNTPCIKYIDVGFAKPANKVFWNQLLLWSVVSTQNGFVFRNSKQKSSKHNHSTPLCIYSKTLYWMDTAELVQGFTDCGSYSYANSLMDSFSQQWPNLSNGQVLDIMNAFVENDQLHAPEDFIKIFCAKYFWQMMLASTDTQQRFLDIYRENVADVCTTMRQFITAAHPRKKYL